MSILKYFKRTPIIQDKELPEPGSSLNNVVSPKAIEMANAKVHPFTVHLIIPPHLMNIEQIDDIRLRTWPTTCSTWLTSFFMATVCGSQGLPILHSQINFSPSNGLVHKLLNS